MAGRYETPETETFAKFLPNFETYNVPQRRTSCTTLIQNFHTVCGEFRGRLTVKHFGIHDHTHKTK